MLVQSLRTDDCIEEIVDKYSSMVYRLALTHIGKKHDAEDVLQDVFLDYISKPRVFNNEAHRKAWLIRVTINKCRSLKSSAWFRKTQPFDELIPFEEKEEIDLYEYIIQLPLKYRSVIHLFYYEDMTTKQISNILKSRESTVRTWLTRARAILKTKMGGDFFND